jgi:hypothetical protein
MHAEHRFCTIMRVPDTWKKLCREREREEKMKMGFLLCLEKINQNLKISKSKGILILIFGGVYVHASF